MIALLPATLLAWPLILIRALMTQCSDGETGNDGFWVVVMSIWRLLEAIGSRFLENQDDGFAVRGCNRAGGGKAKAGRIRFTENFVQLRFELIDFVDREGAEFYGHGVVPNGAATVAATVAAAVALGLAAAATAWARNK
jgi:hypothetical protein